jgi:hypothetical protein
MGSSGKKRTTMAKLNRETRMRDKRADKEARKIARKLAAADGPAPEFTGDETWPTPLGAESVLTVADRVSEAPAEAEE